MTEWLACSLLIGLWLLRYRRQNGFIPSRAAWGALIGYVAFYCFAIRRIQTLAGGDISFLWPIAGRDIMPEMRAYGTATVIGFALVAGFLRTHDFPIFWNWLKTKGRSRELWGIVLTLVGFVLFLQSFFFFILFMAFVAWRVWCLVRGAHKQSDDPYSGKVLDKALQGEASLDMGVWCGRQAGKDTFVSVEDRAVVIGPPGTGKTAFMVTQLLHWTKSKRPFVCLDIKPEVYGIMRQPLEAAGYTVYTYNPSSQTGQRYNMLDDLDSAESIGELAGALIPSPDPADAVFYENARDFLDALITHLRTQGPTSFPKIRDYVQGFEDYGALIDDLLESPSPDAVELARGLSLIAANERMLGSIFAVFRSNLRFLRYPSVRASVESSDFSLKALTEKKPVALFLQFEERHQETTAQLLRAMIGHVFRYFIEHTQRDPILLMLDEIGNVPKLPGLLEKLNTLRSRYLPTWLYWQSLEQMQKYGQKHDEGPNTIMGACDFQMVFRLNDNRSAEWMSKRLGVVERRKSSIGSQIGEQLSLSSQQSLVTEPKVYPHSFQQLKSGEAICVYREEDWKAQATPYFEVYPELKGVRPSGSDCVGEPYEPEEEEKADEGMAEEESVGAV